MNKPWAILPLTEPEEKNATYDPSLLLLGMYLKDSKSTYLTDICTSVSVTAEVVIAK